MFKAPQRGLTLSALTGKTGHFLLGIVVGSAVTLLIAFGEELRGLLQPDRSETEQIQAAIVPADMTLPHNDRIQKRIEHYLHPANKAELIRSYQRGGAYLSVITAILEEYDLPSPLAFLPILESRFIPTSRSPAGAVGLWQIMPSTAVEHGLKVNRWIDERRDPEKATLAAAEYLTYLYRKLGNWEFALAAYNCGPSKLQRAIRSEKATNFWQLRRIPRETFNFVPSFYAILHILQQPDAYGIELPPQRKPLDYESLEIEATFSIDQIAKLAKVPPAVIKKYNPALTSDIAPSGSYTVKVPKGVKEQFLSEYESNPFDRIEVTYTTHRVRRGDTLAEIAKRYGTTVGAIMADNNLRSSRWIKAGMNLRIAYVTINKSTVPDQAETEIAGEETAADERRVRLVHKVTRDGLALATLARYYSTTVARLHEWNPWLRSNTLQSGDEVNIYKTVEQVAFHKARRGDSLWELARRYQTSVSNLKRWNQLAGSRIYPGDNLVVSLR